MQFSYSRFLYLTRPSGETSGDPMIDVAFRGLVAPPAQPGASEADYHADVQRQLVSDLRKFGAKIEENVRLFTKPPELPAWVYDADFLAKVPTQNRPKCVCEVKTSLTKKDYGEFDGTEYRRKQFQVIVLANLGGHVFSTNTRILNLDLPVNFPLPPLAVMAVYALPGQPYQTIFIEPGHLDKVAAVFR